LIHAPNQLNRKAPIRFVWPPHGAIQKAQTRTLSGVFEEAPVPVVPVERKFDKILFDRERRVRALARRGPRPWTDGLRLIKAEWEAHLVGGPCHDQARRPARAPGERVAHRGGWVLRRAHPRRARRDAAPRRGDAARRDAAPPRDEAARCDAAPRRNDICTWHPVGILDATTSQLSHPLCAVLPNHTSAMPTLHARHSYVPFIFTYDRNHARIMDNQIARL